ncbi:MAG: phosphatase PAP2 family protein, partial [Candidatus Saccharibacteria bacterium]
MDKTLSQFKRFNRGNYRYLLYAFTGLFCLFISYLFVKNGQIGRIEQDIFWFFNNLPIYIVNFALVITFAGTIWFAIALAVFMLCWRRFALAAEICIASIGAFLLAGFIKGFGIRLRPYELLNNVHTAGIKYSDMGFPSIHMASATAIAVVISVRLGSGFRLVAWSVVVLVGLSRLVLGMHAPLDIVGGFGVGLIAGSLTNYFAGIPKPKLSSYKSLKIKRKKQKQAAIYKSN